MAFVALPGIIGSKVYRKLRGRMKRKNWEDFVEILLFCILSYALYGAVVAGLAACDVGAASQGSAASGASQEGEFFRAIETIFKKGQSPKWQDILLASITGVAVAFIASYLHRFNVINRAGQAVWATKRYGDEDVWEFFHNSKEVEVAEWLFVRDHKLDLVYFGAIQAFSESGEQRELVMTSVDVYDNLEDSNLIHSAPVLYLSRAADDLTIEIPDVPEGDNRAAANGEDEDGGKGKAPKDG